MAVIDRMGARTLHSLLLVLCLPTAGLAQGILDGQVSFVTAQHVYVRFSSTAGIAVTDTLERVADGTGVPCLVVISMSSTSCVCTVISGCKPQKGEPIRTRTMHPPAGQGAAPRSGSGTRPLNGEDTTVMGRERIMGRLSVATYSTMPSTRENDHRVMYRFSMNANNIANSRFSAETYLNYRQLFPAYLELHPQRTEIFNVYSLAVNYSPGPNTTVSLGRKINNSASSLGAIDGLQMEHRKGRFFAGLIAGSRPDGLTYGLNLDLLQYGGYIGMQLNSATVLSRSTVGLLEQTNTGMTDRRFAYLQHSSTFHGKLDVFSSGELDLYSTTGNNVRLTNLFISSRYRFSRNVDLFASYDSRRRVVYYETFRNEVEQLLEDDEARQAARIRLNVRPVRKLGIGIAYSKRFQADGANASDNYVGTVNLNMDPEGAGRWTIQANRNSSNYVRSDILSFRHTRTLLPKRVNASFYYRMVEYIYANRSDGSPLSPRTSQRYYGADISVNLPRSFTFTMLGELATILEERNYRVNLSLVKRFDSKKR